MKWLRLYSSVLNDPKVQKLPPALFKHWINILCIASENDPRGQLPPLEEVAFALRMKPARCSAILDSLRTARVLDRDSAGTLRVHNWDMRQRKSDDIAARVDDHRKRKEAGSAKSAPQNVTLPETLLKRTVDEDTDTDTEEDIFSPSGKGSYKAADVAAAPPATAAIARNHWTESSAKRTAEEVARRTRLRSNDLRALVSYIMACPHLTHEIVIGEAESFVAWLNKSHRAAEARVFYNKWLKPLNQEMQRERGTAFAPPLATEKVLGNGHTTPDAQPPVDPLYEFNVARARAKLVS